MIVQKTDIKKAFWWLEHQRVFFFASFIIGTTAILSLKILGFHGIFVSLTAVSIMLIYAALGSRQKIQIRLDVLGDNLYYLGFLFTLVSLAYSLHQLGTGQADINNILENFGLAIATTLTGLALRVFFNQPKADIHEYENAIRFSLTEATGNFIGEISKMSRDVSTLSTILNQVVEETRETHKQATDKLNETISNHLNALEKSFDRNQENISKLILTSAESHDKFNENLQKNTDLLIQTIRNVMTNISFGSERFGDEFFKITKSANELQSSIGQLDSIFNNWNTASTNLLNNSETINSNIEKSVSSAIEVNSKFNNYIEDFPSKLDLLTKSFMDSINKISLSLNHKDNQIDEKLNSLSTQINNFQTIINSIDKSTVLHPMTKSPSND